MEKQGWISLHRKLQDNPIYKNSKAVHCWIECLLRASHQHNAIFLTRQKIPLGKGQFCMGREEFGKSVSMSGSTAWFWLLQFKADSMIDIKTTNKGTVITILKWIDYQLVDSTVDSRKTADEQQMNTNNKDNNVNNENKDTHISYLLNIPKEDIEYFTAKYKCESTPLKQKADALHTYCKSKGKKYKNYKAFLENAVRKDFDYRPLNIKKEFEFDPVTKTAKIKSINI